MKTLLVTGRAAVPAPLRDIIERGSTQLVERRAPDVPASAFDGVDRVVFWTGGTEDNEAGALASRYSEAARDDERRDGIIAIRSDEADAPPAGVPAEAAFVWPRDEDRLKMAFLTGA